MPSTLSYSSVAFLVNAMKLRKHPINLPFTPRRTVASDNDDDLKGLISWVRSSQALRTSSEEQTDQLTKLSLRYTYRHRIAKLRDLTRAELPDFTRDEDYKDFQTMLSLRYIYLHRIEELHDLTIGEDFSVSQKSERYFWDFFQTLRPLRETELAIISDGTLSAIWDGKNGDYVGIEFLDSGKLLYTIFKGEMDSAERICEADYGQIKDVESRLGITILIRY